MTPQQQNDYRNLWRLELLIKKKKKTKRQDSYRIRYPRRNLGRVNRLTPEEKKNETVNDHPTLV